MNLTHLILILFFIAPSAPAGVFNQPSPEMFCAELQQGRDQLQSVSRWSTLRDIIKLAIIPGKLVHLKSTLVPISEARQGQLPPSPSTSDEATHLIFSIAPPEDTFADLDLAALRSKQFEWNAEVSRATPELMSFIYAPSVQECTRRMNLHHFDYLHFLALMDQKASFRILDQIDEASHAKRAIQQALRRSRMHWTVIETTDLFAVHEALRNPSVEDIVIFAHGLSSGKLIDSRDNQYPLGFFDDLSPRLRSLTIFACHGLETIETYALASALAKGFSIHPERLVMASQGSLLGGREELVPVTAFRRFLKQVEGRISSLRFRKNSAPIPTQTLPDELQCSLQLHHFRVTQGTYGFILNGNFVGSTQGKTPLLPFEYPCRFLDRAKNILVIRNLGTVAPASIESTQFEVIPSYPGKQLKSGTLIHYENHDHSYQGSKYEFELIN
jgi:hypothetical protein